MKRRGLWIGDHSVQSGFARASHYTVAALNDVYEMSVLGINYRGDPPHEFPYDVWPTFREDAMGVGRTKELIEYLGPSFVVVQQDPWNVQVYLKRIGDVPVIGAVAVDGKNCRGAELNGLACAIFWTRFGEEQARLGGYTGPSAVVPLGVDTTIYYARDRERERAGIRQALVERGLPEGVFIVGSVGRNQLRKRLDLTIEYFAEWVHARQVNDAVLWLHMAPTGDDAFDLNLLGKYYGIADRLMIPTVRVGHGVSEDRMARAYSMFDVLFSTTLGEGWSLPTMEAMACGVPVVAPDYSAIGEWAKDAALLVPCTSSSCHPPRGVSTIGGVMDKQGAIEALDLLYRNKDLRKVCARDGLSLVNRPEYRWEYIGKAFTKVVQETLLAARIDVPTEDEVLTR